MKDYREKEMKYYVIGNILVAMLLSGVFSGLFDISLGKDAVETNNNFMELIKSFCETALLGSVIYVYSYICDSCISSELKEFILFGKAGLPARTIFVRIKNGEVTDKRFTTQDFKIKYSSIISSLSQISDKDKRKDASNAAWYKIYKSKKDDAAVSGTQKDYLLNRDLNTMTIFVFIFYLLVCFVLKLISFSWIFLIFIAVEFILTWIAARNKAMRYVLTVFAKDISAKEQVDQQPTEQPS